MAAGVGKTYRMLQEGQAEADAGRDVVIGYLEPHERAGDERPGARARGRAAAPGRATRRRRARGDGPAGAARPRPRAGADRRARPHQPARARARASATRTSPTCSAAGIDVFSTVNVQHLESLNDQVAELTGVRVRETVPDSVLGSADEVVLIDLTPGGADRAPAGGQDLPGREHRRRAQQLLQDREPGGAARGQPAPGRRGRRVQAPRLRRRRAGRDAATRSASPPTRRRRSASGCWRWSARSPARSAWCAAPGARRSGSAPTSTCSG